MRPVRILEAVIARLGLGDRCHLLAEHAEHGVVPEVGVGAHERALCLGERGRIGEPVLREVGQRVGRLRDLGGGGIGARLAVGAVDELGEHATALLEQPQQVEAELLRVSDLIGLSLVVGLAVVLLHRL